MVDGMAKNEQFQGSRGVLADALSCMLVAISSG